MKPVGLSLSEILLGSMVGVFVLSLGFIFIFLIYQRRMAAKDMYQQQMERLHQKDLLSSVIESQEKERTRIAHDLHDEIGALLATSRLYFNQLSPGQAEEQLQMVSSKVNSLFDEMMANIRRISHDLRPVVLENLGLVEAIDSLSEKLKEAGIGFHFTHSVTFKMTKEAELTLYRILQELISNTLKHAQATTIYLNMRTKASLFFIEYRDDGKGFAPVKTSGGLGMKSIESRLNLFQGHLQMTKQNPGAGFLIEIDINRLSNDGHY